MKVKQIRELSDDELMQKIKDLKGELFNLRFQAATGQLDNPMRIREVRKTIARIKTVLTERQLERRKISGGK
ncbi:50S ribosomal protein L29 [Thermoanaerobacterium sp. DL9XJH110]|jgi:large subunit ribosomal protein L29|uniref:50S ribosomal protein L29 n=1 Tax=Thermoanaerobacterium sp. DL9XJH110 TaxID=3386643 RepID=UPI003BB6F188